VFHFCVCILEVNTATTDQTEAFAYGGDQAEARWVICECKRGCGNLILVWVVCMCICFLALLFSRICKIVEVPIATAKLLLLERAHS
jgi:hypothetical protein